MRSLTPFRCCIASLAGRVSRAECNLGAVLGETRLVRHARTRCGVIESLKSSQRRQGETPSGNALKLRLPGGAGTSKHCILTNSGRAATCRRTGPVPTQSSSLHMRRKHPSAQARAYVLVHVLGRPHGHGGTAQRALASIWPYRVARARAPAALGGSMAADGLWVPRHSHGTQLHGALQHAMRLQMAGGWVEVGGWR